MTAMLLSLILSNPAPPPCPPPLIHTWGVLCVTEAEYQALWNPALPIVVEVDPEDAWRPLVEKYWPPELVDWALRIIQCESGGNPSAKNRTSTAAGLFQFLRSTWNRGPAPALGLPSYESGAVYNAEWNIQAAAWLYAHWGGKSQWECKA